MLQELRRTVNVLLAAAGVAGLVACPQMLSDDFDAAISSGSGGTGCTRLRTCTGGSGGAPSGAGGSTPLTGGNAGSGGSEAFAGAGSEAGAGGTTSGAGGSEPPDASTPPPDDGGPDASAPPTLECRVLVLNGTTHYAEDNCAGVYGWNDIANDTEETDETWVDLGHEDGDACFYGTIAPEGWGAVFNLSFADEAIWDATEYGVEGFSLETTGPNHPPEIVLIYSDITLTDYCQAFTPPEPVSIPFDTTRQDCQGNPGSTPPDPSQLAFLRLWFAPTDDYLDLDFCLRIRAVP